MIASKNAACIMGSWKSKLFLTNLLLASVLHIVNTVVANVHEEAFRGQLYVEYLFSEASFSVVTDFSLLSTNPWVKASLMET